MIPRIANRGHSFKGAGQYYLHDKKADTDERVEWTYTHNLPTDDPHKAMGYMAYTAMNADRLKHQAGIAKTGRKSKAKPVYSYSLSWHPEQQPDQQTMQEAAMEVLEKLGFKDHEAVFVAHNDTDHSHVHVVCNVVHPETGRVVAPSYDYITTSNWAENLELEGGKIYCEQRVINNEKRISEAKQDRQLGMVKHREQKLDRAQIIQDLFEQSDSGKSFQAALETEGYTLAKGDRRSFILVDEEGKTHSLYRQIKGLKAKDINPRLKDIEILPQANVLIEQRREQQKSKEQAEKQNTEKKPLPQLRNDFNQSAEEIKQQKPNIQNDFKKGADKIIQPKPKEALNEEPVKAQEKIELTNPSPFERNNEHLIKLDDLRAWEQKTQRQKDKLTARLEQQYDLTSLQQQIREAQQQLENSNSWWSKITGKHQDSQDHLSALQMNLNNINQRMQEQEAALDRKSLKTKPDYTRDLDHEAKVKLEKDAEIKRVMEEIKQQQNRNKGQDYGREI